TANATIAFTIYTHGYVVGQTVTIVVTASSPTGSSTINPGTYSVTITSVSLNQYSFTPGIPGTWFGTDLLVDVFANGTGSGPQTLLPDTVVATIFRLNQSLPSLPTMRIVGMAGRLFAAPLPGGNNFSELVLPTTAGE